MKKFLLTLSMTALLLFTAGCSCPFSDKTADNKPQMNTAAASATEVAPDFSYKELGSGKTMRLSDLGQACLYQFLGDLVPSLCRRAAAY